ncbi:MAG: efflux RND transporter permease subunit [Bacteroidales bacterium]|nr:efflux RND transporter permease subunit [Bacteroidales bacterium]
MIRLSKLIIHYRKAIIIITLLLTVVMAIFFRNLKIDPDVFNYLPKNDPKAMLFREVGDKYGGNYTGVIGLETDDIFNTATLEHIRQITDSLETIPGVGTVTSLTNIIDIKGSDWGIEIGNLVDKYDIPQTDEELAALKAYALSQDMYRGTLVSEDATFTAVMVKISEGIDKITVATAIQEKVESLNLPEKVYFGGMPFAFKSLADIILGDMDFLAPIAALVIIIVLFLSFRSWRGVVLPLLTVAISIIWTLGLMGLIHIRISIISDVIPVILLAVGSAYTIHVINRVRQTRAENPDRTLQEALAYIIIPVFLAATTTMAGFISFIFGSYLTMISTFGIFMALGVAFAMVLSLTFAPAVMALFPEKIKHGQPLKQNSKDLLDKLLQRIFNLVISHPWRVIISWCIVLCIAIAGIFMIQRKVDILDYFRKSDPTHIAEEIFREKFGGSMPVYLTVKGDVQDPEVLNTMRLAAEFMEHSESVVHTQSVADLIEEMNEVMGEGKVIPEKKNKVDQLWFLLEGQDIMEQLVTYEKDEGLVNATFNTGDVDRMQDFVDKLQGFIDEHPAWKGKVDFTGLPSLYLQIDRSLIFSQMQSLIYATLLVLLLVAIILRSLRRGLHAIIPILATLLVLFGFMGLVKIPLDIATVLVGSVSIGIGVDYAIHMITHFDHEIKAGADVSYSLGHAIRISGRAIVINVLSVALGFMVLMFSNLVPLQRFGLLVAVTMFTSGAAALTLLPATLFISGKFKVINKPQKHQDTKYHQTLSVKH